MKKMLFVAWDKKEKQMTRRVLMGLKGLPVGFKNNGNDLDFNCDDRYVIRQSLLLQDKRGDWIYEGDLLRWDKGVTWRDVHLYKVPELSFNNHSKLLEIFGDNWKVGVKYNNIEIAGNIYQNKKLLKEYNNLKK